MSDASFCSPLNLFFFQFPSPPFQPPPAPSIPPPAALLHPRCSLSPESSASGDFAFSSKRRPRNTWRCRPLSYHCIIDQQEWSQGQEVDLWILGVNFCIWGERALLSAPTHLGNGCLASLPDLSHPRLSRTTRFSWPSAAAQGHTPVSLIKTQPWHTSHTHTHTPCRSAA